MTWPALEALFNVYMCGVLCVFIGGLIVCGFAKVGVLSDTPEVGRRILKYSARAVMFCWAWPLVLAALALIGLWRLADFLVEHAEVEELWNRGRK
ncbi:hypothetical protein [Arthrobacter sp. JUb115]|uniref:hypothetical protein n=1 Tax=Arthrobacter sp. JUb115 TaxID=2485108 RepID=UPI001060B438|nr:hypothetical protein [Arthrobacter sp. JUb115]TDU27079.1 hypothetical protein EDF61_104155 [Arthrobacter sp. JUb115]